MSTVVTRMHAAIVFVGVVLMIAVVSYSAWLINDINGRSEKRGVLIEQFVEELEVVEDTVIETESIEYVVVETEDTLSVPSTYREDLLNKCIAHMKKYEALGKTRYLDNDGSVTIGYGHHILRGEHFANIITEDEADKLLRADFDNYIGFAKKYTDIYSEQLALGMFMYNIGETKFKKSTLRKLVGEKLSIDNEIVKWKHFTYKGRKRTSKGLLERREFERSIYNLNK
tara:strand:+ start:9282 stop:9965 length:684 start_codon:yes stop_codon:yes gene_type:complete